MQVKPENSDRNNNTLKKRKQFSYLRNVSKLSLEILTQIVIHYVKLIFKIFTFQPIKTISGQTALVTGGGNGLGKAICIELAKNGCHVAVVDIDIQAAIKVAEEISNEYQVNSKAYQIDVSSYEEVFKYNAKIEQEMGPIDILVNNAGLMPAASILKVEPAEVDKVFGVNLKAHFWMTQAFLKTMKERNSGHIVAISSLAGLTSVAQCILYSATKYGVKGFMDSLSAELILTNSNIKTSTVFPYFVATSDELVEYLNQMKTLTQHPALKPSRAAREIVQGIVQEKEYIIVPQRFAYLLFLTQLIPKYIWIRAIHKNLPNTTNTRRVL